LRSRSHFPLGKTATHEWNQPLDSFKNKNEIRLITGKAEVMRVGRHRYPQ
jgi:hypothetical protein